MRAPPRTRPAPTRGYAPLQLKIGTTVLLVLHVVAVVTGTGLGEGAPEATPWLIARDVLIALSAAAVAGAWRPRMPLDPFEPADRIATGGIIVFLAMAVTTSLISPTVYTRLAQEDGVVENGTALLFLVSSGWSVAAARQLWRGHGGVPAWATAASVAMAGALLGVVMAGEEISWGQRLFNRTSSGAFLQANEQAETNLHNFLTNPIEAAFYSLILLLLTFWPLLTDPPTGTCGSQPARLLRFLRPSAGTAAVAALTAGLVYDQWNVIILQGCVTATVVALVVGARRAAVPRDRILLLAVAGTVALRQLISLLLGHQYVRGWDVTEYRELLIAMAVMWWTRELYLRARARSTGDAA